MFLSVLLIRRNFMDYRVIQNNYESILEDVKKHSINPEKVKVVAASKYVGADGIKALAKSGVKICGENRVQALRDKREELSAEGMENCVVWHFIGTLQKNKIKYIIDYVDLIQSVHEFSLLEELDKKAFKNARVLDVLLEVNISGEESKHGFEVDEIISKIDEIKRLKNINVKGLMTMAPFTENESVTREVFRGLRLTKDRLNAEEYFDGSLEELSMGMSNDYKVALEEGATIIRIGSRLFNGGR
jgi:hypothetical protein